MHVKGYKRRELEDMNELSARDLEEILYQRELWDALEERQFGDELQERYSDKMQDALYRRDMETVDHSELDQGHLSNLCLFFHTHVANLEIGGCDIVVVNTYAAWRAVRASA
ncbi:hypothetical protein BDQ17DRAFT_1332407 [Cyathus striatus]|nr:hypothetical protein BDQ17DRAFT_1332407 [Cyathus striatus]